MKKVKVKALRPFWVVEDGERKNIEAGKEVEVTEALAAELESAGKVSYDLTKRGRPAKDDAVDPIDLGDKSKKGK